MSLMNPGGTPLQCIWTIYVCVAPKGMVFSHFGHKLGIDFSHFAAILVINRVSIFFVFNSFFFKEATFSSRLSSPICALPTSMPFNTSYTG